MEVRRLEVGSMRSGCRCARYELVVVCCKVEVR